MRRRHAVGSLLALPFVFACAGDAARQPADSATTAAARATPTTPSQYLYVWAGDSALAASDFLAVVDASPASATYGQIVASTPTGSAGTYPHHTEIELAPNRHLLANGYGAGKTWLYDLSEPRAPKILASFGDLAGMNHPHTFVRLPNGNVLATFQYAGVGVPGAHTHGGDAAMKMPASPAHTTGGLVELTEDGKVVRGGSAVDTTIADRLIYPYAVLPIPAFDRALSTTTDMDAGNKGATSKWLQLWRLSDLKLLRSIELPPGTRDLENQWTGEMRMLPDGKSALVHTFGCGMYLVRGLDGDAPSATFVHGFDGKDCGVPLLAGNYWLQPVPDSHAVLSMDVSDPLHPREVSRVTVGDDETPHWLSMEPTGRRIVLNSGGGVKGNRVFVIDFDNKTGALHIDDKFRDAGATTAGVRLTNRTFPHGFTGTAYPHGTVFSR